MDKVRVLFLPTVDSNNTNAQSLTTREIVLRLDSTKIHSTLWYEWEPDPRLQNRPGIWLERLPRRGKTRRILKEMLAGYDVIAYMDYSPASYLFLHLPRLWRRAKTVFHAEAPSTQMVNPPRTLRFLFEGIFPRCDSYTAITEFVARDIHRCIAKKVNHILCFGVDANLFSPASKPFDRDPVVLFTGTLIERKGPQLVLDAAVRFPGTTFRLVGAGRDGFERVLQERVAREGLKNVKLEGPKSQLQLAEIMRNSDIFLFPSRLEGMPKVTLEASATGLPCIIFRDYETPSVVDGITGFQVGTIEEMMQALGRLIGDRSLRERMGAAARKHMEKFEWDVVSRQWQNAYLEIAAAQVK